MREATVAAGIVNGLLDYAVSKGADRAVLMGRAHLRVEDLVDLDARILFSDFKALMRAGQALTGDPALALHFGEEVDLSELSIAALLSHAAETVADSIAQSNRYGRLAIDGVAKGDRYRMEHVGSEVWMIDCRDDPNDFPELTEMSFARMVCSGRRAFGDRPLLKAVHMTHPAPPYRAEYERIFGMPVVFGAERNALLADDWFLSYRPPKPPLPPYVAAVLRERAEAMLRDRDRGGTVRGRVEDLLAPLLHSGGATMEAVAASLGFSRPTLARRLKAEGTTFEGVLDGLRRELALQYLETRKASVNETAYLVGFSDPSALSRAVRRWTGASPRALRQASSRRGLP